MKVLAYFQICISVPLRSIRKKIEAAVCRCSSKYVLKNFALFKGKHLC